MSGSIFKNDDWALIEATSDTERFVVRAHRDLPCAADRERYRYLVSVNWRYGSADMPDSQTLDAMARFFERVILPLESEALAFEAASITGGGRREWRLYTSSMERFLGRLNKLVGADKPRIKLESFDDPDWRALSEFHRAQ
jgi:Family of unknown function (DUF695)